MDIVTRQEWGARPAKAGMTPHAVTRAVLHHTTGTALAGGSHANWWRNIQSFHMDANKWSDTGYHYGVAPDGTVLEGRDVQFTGAHVRGHNTGRLGIAILGDTRNEGVFTPAVQHAIRGLLIQHSIPLTHVTGHSDHAATVCPGPLVIAWIRAGLPSPGVEVPPPGAPVPPPAAPRRTLTVLAPGLNVRTGRGTRHRVVGVMPRGTVATVGAEVSGWVEVFAPLTGFAAARFLGAAPPRPMPVLRRGARGGAVRTLQTALNAAGAKPRVPVTGFFGPLTDAAVRTFQRRRKLTADGVVGPRTWAALR